MSLSVANLTVRYGSLVALDRVNLDIGSGERFALMGPSGSGKSSLLRAVAGIVPSHGTITVDGESVEAAPTHERPIGLMFQDFALFPHMSVGDNVAYGLRMQGVSRPERSTRVRELLDVVGLGGYEARDPATLSGGEQQRVALARTLAPSPKLLMLDEPLGSLDLAWREELLGEITRIVTDIGVTAVYVTHDRGEAFAFGERMAVVADGAIEIVGKPHEVWADPKTLTVARLIGHPNVLEHHPWGTDPLLVPDTAFAVTGLDPAPVATGVERSWWRAGGVVRSSVFADGDYLNHIDIDGATGTLVVRTRERSVGVKVEVAIDPTAVVPLAV